MAHELATANDMAFVGETPWHGLGNPLSPKQPIEVWQRQAGMDWTIEETDVLYSVKVGLDEAATRRKPLLWHHELFCTFIPSIPRE
jgi:hypothetical protein